MKTLRTSLIFALFLAATSAHAIDGQSLICSGTYSDASSSGGSQRLDLDLPLTPSSTNYWNISAKNQVTTRGGRFIIDEFAVAYTKDGALVYRVNLSVTDTKTGVVSRTSSKSSEANLAVSQGSAPKITEVLSLKCDLQPTPSLPRRTTGTDQMDASIQLPAKPLRIKFSEE